MNVKRFLGAVACSLCLAGGAVFGADGVLPAWQDVGDDASANRVIRSGSGQPPVKYGDLTRRGSVELPATGPHARMQWDLELPFDFSKAYAFAFDIRVDDLSAFKGAMFYFRSGAGWYSTSLSLPDEGTWIPVELKRGQGYGIEGKPAGWHKIDGLRIAFDRGSDMKSSTISVADFRLVMDENSGKVLVLRGKTSAVRAKREAGAYLHFASTMDQALERLGVAHATVDDDAVTAETLKGKSVAILPFNGFLPQETTRLLREFSGRGGKLFVLYSLPSAISDVMGVGIRAFRQSGENGMERFAGLLRTGDGIADLPAFSRQESNNANEPFLKGTGEIVATWCDGKKNSLGIPALLKTAAGVYMGHVWLPDAGDRDGLLKAILSDLDPSLKEGFAAAEARAKALAEKRLVFVKSIPGKTGERRLVWCHNARGLGARYDWDSSIRFLKENGFTDIIANLAWADCAFYDSKVVPVHESVATRGDTFEQCRAACRKYGIGFHVWRVCFNTGSHASRERVEKYQAEGRLVQAYDPKAKNPWSTTFCPSHPENRKLEIEAMVELARKGADGIHFDYIRYADANFCFCDGCRTRFESETGLKAANWPADTRNDPKIAEVWTAWRAANISAVVSETARRVRAEFPKVEISIAARADRASAYAGDGQDWARWSREGWIDILCPMDYTASTPFFRNAYREQEKILKGTRVKLYPGIGLSCWKADGSEAERMAKHIQALRADGLQGFTVFNFDGRAEASFPLLHQGPTR